MGKKKSEVQIEVKVPTNHTMKVPKGTEDLVAGLFAEAGLKGKFVLFLGEFAKGTAHIQGISVRPRTDERVIILRVQPGDNKTNQLLKYMVPNGVDPAEFHQKLLDAEERMEMGSRLARLEKKMRKLYRLLKGESFSLETVPQSALDELNYKSAAELGGVLEDLARHRRFVKTQAKKPGWFEWRDEFREKMLAAGYNPKDDRPSAVSSPEENDEEFRLFYRSMDIEEELKRLEDGESALQQEQSGISLNIQVINGNVRNLNKQIQEQQDALNVFFKKEEELSKKANQMKSAKKELEKEKERINDRLNEIEAQKKVERACAAADPALNDLSPAEQAEVLKRLLQSRPELAGLAAEILKESQPSVPPAAAPAAQ